MASPMAAARVSKTPDTSIRVDQETKTLLEQLRTEMSQQAGADLSYKQLLEALARQAKGAPPRPFALPVGAEIDLSEDLDPIRAEIEELREQLAGLAGLNFATLLPDPNTGVLFDALAAPHGKGGRGVDGARILPPEKGARFAAEGGIGLFDNEPASPGWWVRCPSGVYLTERDGTLPERIEDLYEDAARKERKAQRGRKDGE